MKNKILISIIICMLSFNLTAQYSISQGKVSGYLGKKFYLNLECDFLPFRKLYGFEQYEYFPSSNSDEYRPYMINRILDWNGSYALNFGAVLRNNLVLENAIGYKQDLFYAKLSNISHDRRYSQVGIKDKFYKIGIKYFILGGLAPYGKYILANIKFSQTKLYDNGGYFNNDNPIDITQFNVQFQVGVGTQKILFKSLVFDWAMTLGLNSFSLQYKNENRKVKKDLYDELNMTPLEYSFKGYLHNHALFNFKVGLGYLF